ncbi:MAG: aminotransferase class IV, partial [Candidatus Omnitrophota bacterium]|nr:aminotransferase class IV [Candidatus Omnitrophota bacterium]
EQYVPPPDKYYENGIAVDIAEARRNTRTVLKNFKVVSYLESILARNEALPKGCFDTIFLNDAGYVCEGSTSNIFMVSGNKLLTPSPDCGALPGITRKIILEISRYAGLGMQEGKFISDDLKNASEVFITNSLFEVMPVVKVEDKIIGKGVPGVMTKKIHGLYKELIEKERNA